MKRIQARVSSGRFVRNTPENTLGLHIPICPACNRLNPYPMYGRDERGFSIKNPPPTHCHACGASLTKNAEVDDAAAFADDPTQSERSGSSGVTDDAICSEFATIGDEQDEIDDTAAWLAGLEAAQEQADEEVNHIYLDCVTKKPCKRFGFGEEELEGFCNLLESAIARDDGSNPFPPFSPDPNRARRIVCSDGISRPFALAEGAGK